MMKEISVWYASVQAPACAMAAAEWLLAGGHIYGAADSGVGNYEGELSMSSTMSRRALLRGAAGRVGTFGAASLLSACVSSQPAAKPAETKPAAPAATTA